MVLLVVLVIELIPAGQSVNPVPCKDQNKSPASLLARPSFAKSLANGNDRFVGFPGVSVVRPPGRPWAGRIGGPEAGFRAGRW